MPVFKVGGKARLKAAFHRRVGGSKIPTDPSSVTAKIETPLGNVSTLVYTVDAAVKRLSTGVYYVDQSVNIHGEWWHRWIGTGDVVAADEAMITVKPSRFPDTC